MLEWCTFRIHSVRLRLALWHFKRLACPPVFEICVLCFQQSNNDVQCVYMFGSDTQSHVVRGANVTSHYNSERSILHCVVLSRRTLRYMCYDQLCQMLMLSRCNIAARHGTAQSEHSPPASSQSTSALGTVQRGRRPRYVAVRSPVGLGSVRLRPRQVSRAAPRAGHCVSPRARLSLWQEIRGWQDTRWRSSPEPGPGRCVQV